MTDASGVLSLGRKLIRLARITARVVTVAFMLVVVVGATWWGWRELKVLRTEMQVSVSRKWDVPSLPLVNPVHVILKTRCAESKLSLKLAKQGADIDEDRSKLVELLNKNIAAFFIQFYDADGFLLITVTVEGLITVVDKKGRAYGLEANAFDDCDARVYHRAAKATVGWKER